VGGKTDDKECHRYWAGAADVKFHHTGVVRSFRDGRDGVRHARRVRVEQRAGDVLR
jgi:hypothetical protein